MSPADPRDTRPVQYKNADTEGFTGGRLPFQKSIRRVQNDCDMLYYCLNDLNKNKEYNGFIVSYSSKYDNYMVYIPEIKMTSYIKSESSLPILEQHRFTMHIFNDEFSLKQKVRLQLIL